MNKILVSVIAGAMLMSTAACGGSSKTPAATTRATTAATTAFTIATQAATTAAPEAAAEKATYKMAEMHKSGYPTEMGDVKFAELVEEKTGGSIVIEVHNAQALGDENTTAELTTTGEEVQFNRLGTGILANYNPKFNALSMPYLYRSTEHMFNVLDGEIGDEFLEIAKDEGLLGLAWFDPGTRNFYNGTREIRTPKDMEGMKIRVQQTPLMMKLIESFGASPTPLSMAEVRPGIADGVIDGAENNWPSFVNEGHYEVAKFITLDAHTRAPELILVNTGVWDSFSEEQQAQVKEAAIEAAKFQRDEWARQESDFQKTALDSGVQVTELTEEEFALFVEAVQPIYEMEEYSQYSDVYDKIKATN